MGGPSRSNLFLRSAKFVVRHPMVAGFGILLVSTLAMRLTWGWQVGREVSAQAEMLRARGAAIEISDINPEAVPDSRNARALIIRAAANDNGASPANQNTTYPNYPPFGDRWEQAAGGSESINACVFVLARQLRHMDRPDARTPLTSPMIGVLLPHLNPSRQIANTVGDGALYAHLYGNDREALERLLDMLHLSRLVRQDPFLVSQLVGVGISALTTSRLNVIAPGLQLSDPDVRRLAKKLIAALLDDVELASQMQDAIRGERLMMDDTRRVLSTGAWAIRPLAQQELSYSNRRFAIHDDAVGQTTAPAAEDVLTRLGPVESMWSRTFGKDSEILGMKMPNYTRWYSAFDFGPRNRYFTQEFRSIGERRAAAVGLAIQLYRADHAGKIPKSLDQLVPDYLAALPADPFSATKAPIGYVIVPKGLPDGTDRPLVFFDAGPDLPGSIDSEPMIDWMPDPWQRADAVRQYRDVSRWAPTTRRVDTVIQEEIKAEEEKKAEEEQLRKDGEERLRLELLGLPEPKKE